MSDDKFSLRCERVQPGVPGSNNRVYPPEVLKQMVEQIQRKLSIGVFFGRLGASTSVKIQMRDAAFRVTAARIEHDGHLGVDCEILNTPKGVELEEMIEKLGTDAFEVVPCGIGSTSHINGCVVVGEDYRLASLDIEPKVKGIKVEKTNEVDG